MNAGTIFFLVIAFYVIRKIIKGAQEVQRTESRAARRKLKHWVQVQKRSAATPPPLPQAELDPNNRPEPIVVEASPSPPPAPEPVRLEELVPSGSLSEPESIDEPETIHLPPLPAPEPAAPEPTPPEPEPPAAEPHLGDALHDAATAGGSVAPDGDLRARLVSALEAVPGGAAREVRYRLASSLSRASADLASALLGLQGLTDRAAGRVLAAFAQDTGQFGLRPTELARLDLARLAEAADRLAHADPKLAGPIVEALVDIARAGDGAGDASLARLVEGALMPVDLE